MLGLSRSIRMRKLNRSEGEDAERHGEEGQRGAVGGGFGERKAEKDDGDDEGGVAEDHLVAAGDVERQDEDEDVGEDHDGEEVVVEGGDVLDGRAMTDGDEVPQTWMPKMLRL